MQLKGEMGVNTIMGIFPVSHSDLSYLDGQGTAHAPGTYFFSRSPLCLVFSTFKESAHKPAKM